MSAISSVGTPSAFQPQIARVQATDQAAKNAASHVAANDPDHDGDNDGARPSASGYRVDVEA